MSINPPFDTNPLFTRTPDADFDTLAQIDAYRATSWSQIALQCAVHGIDITYELFSSLVIASGAILNLHLLMAECIDKPDFLPDLICREEIVDVVYFMSNPHFMDSSLICTLRQKVPDDIIAAYSASVSNEKIWMFQDWDYSKSTIVANASVKRAYALMNMLDKRFPLMFLKFFDQHKRDLFTYDKQFVEWVMKKTQAKAKACPQTFGKVLDALQRDKMRLQKQSMFLQ